VRKLRVLLQYEDPEKGLSKEVDSDWLLHRPEEDEETFDKAVTRAKGILFEEGPGK